MHVLVAERYTVDILRSAGVRVKVLIAMKRMRTLC